DGDDDEGEEDRRRHLARGLGQQAVAVGAGGACSSFLCDASIMTISASTVAPMAMAIPPRLMIVDGMSRKYMGMNARATAMGRVRMGRRALRRWRRNRMITAATVIASSRSADLSVRIDRSMIPERS